MWRHGYDVLLRDTDFFSRGPLLFCLLLSFLLSINARDDQRSLVFSGVFATIWLGEAIVTFQIKLLGGNMYVLLSHEDSATKLTISSQLILPIRLHHRLHTLPSRHRLPAQRPPRADHRPHTSLHRSRALVTRSGCKHFGGQRRGEEPGLAGRVPSVRLLRRPRLPLLHLLANHTTSLSPCMHRSNVTGRLRKQYC